MSGHRPTFLNMLPVAYRITRPADFSAVMRGGAKAGSSTVVASVLLKPQTSGDEVRWRCGLVVSKAVGNAVLRHRASRRLRHLMRDADSHLKDLIPDGFVTEIVLRALQETPHADPAVLHSDLHSALRRAVIKAVREHR